MSKTVAQALTSVTRALSKVAQEEAAQQARLLLCHVLGCAPGGLPPLRERTLDEMQTGMLDALLTRRLQNEPLQYLLGEWEFMGLSFNVSPKALIPRQDTETLATHALALIKANGYKTVLDLCCGTGCIGISLAKIGGVQVTSADVSPDCVELTKENAKKNGVALEVLLGDWFAPITSRYDIIVSNPPYIESALIDGLQPEIQYEPRLALDGGEDGLHAYRVISKEYRRCLHTGGTMLLEIGMGQADAVTALFEGETDILPDLNGVPRVLCVRG